MSVIVTLSEMVSPTTLRFEYSSDLPDPMFYIYVYSTLITTTPDTHYELEVPTDEWPAIDILDDAGDTPPYSRDGHEMLYWAASPDTASYRIDERVASEWVKRGSVETEGNMTWYSFRTPLLDDETDYLFRVVPVGINGNDGDQLLFDIQMVRVPDVTAINVVYNNVSGKITVSEE